MNYKVAVGEIFKKLGILKISLKVVNKLGYFTKFKDHHSNGIDMVSDIAHDTSISDIRTVFDVGASIGTMTEYFLDIFPLAKVYAFEPYVPSYNAFMKRYGNSSRVQLFGVGLSDAPGESVMYLQSDSGYNSLNDVVNKPSDAMHGESQKVEIDTIENICKKAHIESIDFLKIDTEGLDLKVLKGCESMLKNGKVKYIFVECTFHKDNLQNTQFAEICDYLQSFNFKVRAIYDQSNYGEKTYLTCVNAMFFLQPN